MTGLVYTGSTFPSKGGETIEAIQLRWANWNSLTDFIKDKRYFGGGVFLDDVTRQPLPEGTTSSTVGMYLHTNHGKVLARQDDYIVRFEDNSYGVLSPLVFNRFFNVKEEQKVLGPVRLEVPKTFPNI